MPFRRTERPNKPRILRLPGSRNRVSDTYGDPTRDTHLRPHPYRRCRSQDSGRRTSCLRAYIGLDTRIRKVIAFPDQGGRIVDEISRGDPQAVL